MDGLVSRPPITPCVCCDSPVILNQEAVFCSVLWPVAAILVPLIFHISHRINCKGSNRSFRDTESNLWIKLANIEFCLFVVKQGFSASICSLAWPQTHCSLSSWSARWVYSMWHYVLLEVLSIFITLTIFIHEYVMFPWLFIYFNGVPQLRVLPLTSSVKFIPILVILLHGKNFILHYSFKV